MLVQSVRELLSFLLACNEDYSYKHCNRIVDFTLRIVPGHEVDDQLIFDLLSFGAKKVMESKFKRRCVKISPDHMDGLFSVVVDYVENKYSSEHAGLDRWYMTSGFRELEIQKYYGDWAKEVLPPVESVTKLLHLHYLNCVHPAPDKITSLVMKVKGGVVDLIQDLFSEDRKFELHMTIV